MAEYFRSFISTSTSGTKVLVPYCNESINIDDNAESLGSIYRDASSTVQIHSLYITKVSNTRYNSDARYKDMVVSSTLESNFNYIDLYIEDTTGAKIYIGYDIQIVPGAPYYIEKNITLNPTQKLVMDITPNRGKNGTDKINVVASSVILVDE